MPTTPVSAQVIRYAAFTDDPGGGNPAGIVLDASSLDEQRMLEVAYSRVPIASTGCVRRTCRVGRARATKARSAVTPTIATNGLVGM